MADWAISNHPQQSTMQVLRTLDCPMRDDNDEMLTCLQKKRYQDILKVHVSSPEFTTTFGPVIDNFIVPNDPQKMMQHGRFKRFVIDIQLSWEISVSYSLIFVLGMTFCLASLRLSRTTASMQSN